MIPWLQKPFSSSLQKHLFKTSAQGITFHLGAPILEQGGFRIDDSFLLKRSQENEDGYSILGVISIAEKKLLHQNIDRLIDDNQAFGVPFSEFQGTQPCLFLDRDGILIQDTGYPHRIQDLHLIEDCLHLMEAAKQKNYKIIIVTNQAGIAKGVFTEDQYSAFTEHLLMKLQDRNLNPDGVYHCPWHIKGKLYQRDSLLRKPHPGMILSACADHDIDLSKSIMVGDKDSDRLLIPELRCFVLQGDYPLQSPLQYQIHNLKEIEDHL